MPCHAMPDAPCLTHVHFFYDACDFTCARIQPDVHPTTSVHTSTHHLYKLVALSAAYHTPVTLREVPSKVVYNHLATISLRVFVDGDGL